MVDNSHGEPIAIIDSSDNEFIKPIREFLEANGCRVLVNNERISRADYYIVAGDIRYVKAILAKSTHSGEKRLLIIWNSARDTIDSFDKFKNDKVVINAGNSLSSRNVSDLFSFFFISADTILNFGQQRTAPVDEIKYSTSDENKNTQYLAESKQKNEVNKIIRDVFSNSTQNQKKENFKNWKNNDRGNAGNYIKIIWRIFALCIFFPILWYGTMSTISILSLNLLMKNLLEGNIDRAKISYTLGTNALAGNDFFLFLTGKPLTLFKLGKYVREPERFQSFLQDIFKSAGSALSLYSLSRDLTNQLFEPQGLGSVRSRPSIAAVVDKLHNEFFYVQTYLGLAQGNLESILEDKSFPFVLPILLERGRQANDKIEKFRQTLKSMDQFVTIFPMLAGFRKEQTYLLLFQNSSELRPSGGFIGSTGLATFSEGRLRTLQVQDVYDLDGQLKGHVDPPEPIAKFLGNEHWYLRDSNWDPDFRVSGARAAWFYEKITGTSVDGVIAINSLFLVDMLKVLGPIDLPDYNDRITAENFFGKSLYYTKENFFPGSTQKKDFLGSLTRAIIAKATTGEATIAPKIFNTTIEGIEKKDLQFFIKDPEVAMLLTEYGWNGSLQVGRGCEVEREQRVPCITDYLHINEANLSVNKVNYFLKRTAALSLNINESNQITGTLTLHYLNTSPDEGNGGGGYRSYLRLFLPEDTSLDSISLDGNSIPKQEQGSPLVEPYYELVPAPNGLRGIGLIFGVEPKGERRLTFAWHRQISLSLFDRIGVYEYLLQKQPGTVGDQLEITVSYPNTWKIAQEKEKTSGNIKIITGKNTFLAKENKLEYNKVLTSDIKFKLYLSH